MRRYPVMFHLCAPGRSRLLLLFASLLLLTACAPATRSLSESSALRVQAPPVDQSPSLDQLVEAVLKADGAMKDAYLTLKDKAAYKKAWDEFLPAVDAALAHPEGWSLKPGTLPLKLAVNQPDFRVFFEEGYYQYLGEDPALKNFWVQWRDQAGVTHAQALYRGRGHIEHDARAYGSLLLLLSGAPPARLEAWQLRENAWQRVNETFSSIGDQVGDMAVSRTETEVLFAGGWWRSFTPDGSKRDYSDEGVPYLCPSFDSPALRCYKLQVVEGRGSFTAPDPNQVARLRTPASIKENLSVGYFANGPQSADPALAHEAAARAEEGLLAYLKLPVSQQLAPKVFQSYFQDTKPGSVRVIDLAPNVRVYSMITRPDYNPQAKAFLQWWSDPDRPQVMIFDMEMYDRLLDATLLGEEPDRVLVYTSGTFPTRHQTGRVAVALRFDHTQQAWIPDTRAFPANLPTKIGGVALFRHPDGSGLGMSRPDNPPVGNEVRLDTTGLTICDTKELCLTLRYQDHRFVTQP